MTSWITRSTVGAAWYPWRTTSNWLCPTKKRTGCTRIAHRGSYIPTITINTRGFAIYSPHLFSYATPTRVGVHNHQQTCDSAVVLGLWQERALRFINQREKRRSLSEPFTDEFINYYPCTPTGPPVLAFAFHLRGHDFNLSSSPPTRARFPPP